MNRRIERLNSLLKEVISDVIRRDVKNPHFTQMITIMHVEIANDLHHAKVFVSVIGDKQAKQEALKNLQSAAGFISVHASKQVVMRYFPELTFILDESIEHQMRIEELIDKIEEERSSRE